MYAKALQDHRAKPLLARHSKTLKLNKGGYNDDELTKGIKDKTKGLVNHGVLQP